MGEKGQEEGQEKRGEKRGKKRGEKRGEVGEASGGSDGLDFAKYFEETLAEQAKERESGEASEETKEALVWYSNLSAKEQDCLDEGINSMMHRGARIKAQRYLVSATRQAKKKEKIVSGLTKWSKQPRKKKGV